MDEMAQLKKQNAELLLALREVRGALSALTTEITTNQALMDNISLAILSAAITAEGEDTHTAANAAALYTCKGKGGEYELIGIAKGAGLVRDSMAMQVYRDTGTGQLYFRTMSDFEARMEPVAADKAPAADAAALSDLDNTAKEALRDLSHVENHLEQSDAPTTIKNRAVDVRLCIKELRAALKTHTPTATSAAALPVGFEAMHLPYDDAMTAEYNAENCFMVKRIMRPFCGTDGVRVWTGPTLQAAIETACKALGIPDTPAANGAGGQA